MDGRICFSCTCELLIMEHVIIDKLPLLRVCRNRLSIRYGVIDYHELINRISKMIRGSVCDENLLHVVRMSIVPKSRELSNNDKAEFMGVLFDVRDMIFGQIVDYVGEGRNIRIKHIPTYSKMSLTFKVAR